MVTAVLVLGLLLGDMAAPVSAAPKKVNLTIASGFPYGALPAVTFLRDMFKPEVDKRLAAKGNYQIQWTEGYGGSIAKIGSVFEAVEGGITDLGFSLVAFEWSKLKLQNISYMVPFGPDDPEIIGEAFHEMQETFPACRDAFLKYNQMYLASEASDSFNLFTNFKVMKMEDLKGHKLSTGAPSLILIKVAGGVPVEGHAGEWYNMAKTGLIDGAIIMGSSGAGFKLFEVLPQYVKANFGSRAGGLLTVNKDYWSKLPEEVQTALKESAIVWHKANLAATKQRIVQSEKRIVGGGGTISDLPESERMKWANALPPIMQTSWAKEAMTDGLPVKEAVNTFIDLVEKRGGHFARDWRIK